ncbi:MAG: sialidase family protein [Acidimicrobiales bacterium]
MIALVSTSGGRGGSGSGPFVGADLHSLIADPSTPGRIFVGGHQGVAVSSDNGHTFTPVHSLDGADAMGWAFTQSGVWQSGHPGLHLATTGLAFAGHNRGLPSTDVHAFGGAKQILYAAGPVAGVFASTDDGGTWTVRAPRAGQSFIGHILVDPANTDHIVASAADAGAVESSDGGRTWKVLGGAPGATWVSWPGGDPARLIVSGEGPATASTDGGKTWTPVHLPNGASIVEASPTDANLWYAAGLAGTDASVWVSRDAGTTWQRP